MKRANLWYSETMIAASLLSSPVTVTVGTGGAGGISTGASTGSNAGSYGGVTSFGAWLHVPGAEGGPIGSLGQYPYPGDGAIRGSNGSAGSVSPIGAAATTRLSYAEISYLRYRQQLSNANVSRFASSLVTGGGSGGVNNTYFASISGTSGGYAHGSEKLPGDMASIGSPAGRDGESQSLTGTFSGGGGGSSSFPFSTDGMTNHPGGAGGWPGGGGAGGNGPGQTFTITHAGNGGKGGDGGIRVTTYF